MKRASLLGKNWCEEAYWAGKGLKNLTLIWQNDHTALQTHVALLRNIRMLVEHHNVESRKQRQHAEEVSTNVIRLEEALTERDREYEEMIKLREKECQDRLDSIVCKVDALEKGIDVPVAALDDTNAQRTSQVNINQFFVVNWLLTRLSSWMQIWDLAKRKIIPSLPILQSCRVLQKGMLL